MNRTTSNYSSSTKFQRVGKKCMPGVLWEILYVTLVHKLKLDNFMRWKAVWRFCDILCLFSHKYAHVRSVSQNKQKMSAANGNNIILEAKNYLGSKELCKKSTSFPLLNNHNKIFSQKKISHMMLRKSTRPRREADASITIDCLVWYFDMTAS